MTERRIFAVPCRLHVECTLYILATDLTHARRVVSLVNLQDYLTFDNHSVTTDGPRLLRVNDVVTFSIDPGVADIVPLSTDEYPPNTHPDFAGQPIR